MKLNKNSWHYKVWNASFNTYEQVPERTNLCSYCHRIFWHVLWQVLMIAMLAFVAFMALYGIIYQGFILHTLLAFEITGGILGTLAGIFGIAYSIHWYIRQPPRSREPTTLIGKYIKATKQKVCPLVEFSDEDS